MNRLAALLALALLLAACAGPAGSPPARASSPSLRCVNEPERGGSVTAQRPLFFFLCIQAP